MEKKKSRKASRSVKNLSVKAGSAKRVKGGALSLTYGKVSMEYKPQKPDGSL